MYHKLKTLLYLFVIIVALLTIFSNEILFTFTSLVNEKSELRDKTTPLLHDKITPLLQDKTTPILQDKIIPLLQLQPKKVVGMNIFVYTAVAVNISDGKTDIRIQAFKHDTENKTLKCCFKDQYGKQLIVEATVKYSYSIDYASTAFNCIVNSEDVPKTISVGHNCSKTTELEVSQPEKPKGSISVCFHAMYGFPDTQLMTEWFEFIKLQGVKRVFIYPISHENFVDERSLRVLEFYKSQGLVNLIPYELRQYSTNKERFKVRTEEMYSDEILPVFDCMVRSSLYKYTAYIDYDEVIMFNSNSLDLADNLDKLLNKEPNAGMFVLNWTSTHPSELILMKYINRTTALDDRKKMVYVQGRYKMISPHHAFPIAGFKGVLVPEETAAIHHYRSCRLGWSDDYCLNTTRYRDDAMLKFEPILNEKVQVPEHIRN